MSDLAVAPAGPAHIAPCLYEIPASTRRDMRVPARVYADELLWKRIRGDASLTQLMNVATLPGVHGAIYAMHDVHEGYGTTETTPVASVNIPGVLVPDYWFVQQGGKEGTVGLPLPGSTFKIVDPVTLEELPPGEAGGGG